MSSDTATQTPTRNDISQHQSRNSLSRHKTRNEQFNPEHEPFKDNYALQLNDEEVHGAIWFMNPTRAMFTYLGSAELIRDAQGNEEFTSRQGQEYADHSSDTADVEYKWTARDNRKGRHSLVVHQSSEHYNSTPPISGISRVLPGIWRMATTFSFSDISYLTAISVTLGVVILLINSVLSVIPEANHGWVRPSGLAIWQGILSVVGCFFFLVSSFLAFVEAVNANRRGCFGWKRQHISYHDMDEAGLESAAGATRLVPDWNIVRETNNFGNLFRNFTRSGGADLSTDNLFGADTKDSGQDKHQWRLFPTNRELWKHFIYDLGFVTCSLLLFSSFVFTGAGVVSMVSIVTDNGRIAKWIRIPQIIAGTGFMLSSLLFMLETQPRWLKPQFHSIGWHLNLWNFIGSMGFTLCAAFAYAAGPSTFAWANGQLAYSFMWGSFGFLIGSLMQWYEALDKHPVQTLKKKAHGEK